MEKISIIIPIFNVEKYIECCVRSLFNQSYNNIEYIFINDCSPDNSVEIVKNVLKDYPLRKSQVKILHNVKNQGQIQTRKKGIMSATGDYVIHCDPDDWVETDWLYNLHEEAIESNADLVWCDFTKYYEDGITKYFSNTANTTKEDALLKLITGPRWGSLCINLVKREIAQSTEIIWPSWNYCEDLALIFQYTAIAKKVSYINKSLYWYRNNKLSICNVKEDSKVFANINGAINAIQIEMECSRNLGLYNKFKPYLITEIFKAKRKVFQMASSNLELCKLWHGTDDHLNFLDIWQSNMSFKKKIINSIIYIYLYPIIMKLIGK